MIQRPRGTIDILPGKAALWQKVENTLRDAAALHGFSEIRIPTFESSELYKRGVGETSDVVQKEMYSFYDNDGRNLTLRPEGTAGVVRSVIENSLTAEAMPLALYYLISCFRYEKPEAGRSREFFQFGAELFGAESAGADADVILFVADIFKKLGIQDISLEINSIGCKRCRPLYHRALRQYFEKYRGDLCDTCLSRLEVNPLRILDCKSPVCSAITASAPNAPDYLCDDCAAHFEELKALLDSAGAKYKVNPRIVRGLDYYQRTVFEFVSTKIGSQGTICGGGRYDGLVEELGGPKLPGIGFAMGLTRIMLALEAQGAECGRQSSDIYLASMGADAARACFKLAQELYSLGIKADFDKVGRSLKAQMKYADKKNASFAVVVGADELSAGRAKIKNMLAASQSDGDDEISLNAASITGYISAYKSKQN
ncbi:MAG: histidine--tRNA ligase [Oscillospiraceae bacterium]|nr:histidine--tRNA ligase [Oscillospiraceae bacterium]